MSLVEISVEEYNTKASYGETRNNFDNTQVIREMEGTIPITSTTGSMNNTAVHFIYGFIIFLAICILFSLGRAIYYCISISIGTGTETTESSTHTASPSTSSRPETSTQEELENADINNTERLNIHLEKLRKMLNDVNARLGVSSDTIDLQTASAPYVGHLKQSSSDLDTLWSSIDFDDDFESTVYDDYARKTPTERSVSPSISYSFSDASKSRLHSTRSLSAAIYPKPTSHSASREVSSLSTPSNVITQLLELLDSFIPKAENTKVPLTTDCKYSEKTKLSSKAAKVNPESYLSSYVHPTLPSSDSKLVNALPSTSRLSESCKSECVINSFFEPETSTSGSNFSKQRTIYSENESFESIDVSTTCNILHKHAFSTVYKSVEPCCGLKHIKMSSTSESVNTFALSLSFETAHGKTSSSEFFDAKMPSSSTSEEDQAFSSLESVQEKSSILSRTLNSAEVYLVSPSMIKKLPVSASEPAVSRSFSSAMKSNRLGRSLSETRLFDRMNALWSSDSTNFVKSLSTHTNISSSKSTSSLPLTPSEAKQGTIPNYKNIPKYGKTESHKTHLSYKAKCDKLFQLTNKNLENFESLKCQNLLPHSSFQNKSMGNAITPISQHVLPEMQFSSTPFAYKTPNVITTNSVNETNWRTPLEYDLSPKIEYETNNACDKAPCLLNSNAWSTPPAP